MNPQGDELILRCVERLRELPFVVDVQVRQEAGRDGGRVDGIVRLVTTANYVLRRG